VTVCVIEAVRVIEDFQWRFLWKRCYLVVPVKVCGKYAPDNTRKNSPYEERRKMIDAIPTDSLRDLTLERGVQKRN
jgi:hypothetical protein